ncbi:MAG: hypothetical protein Q9226_004655, partial [Calogaya cf. arnoldii]
MYQPLRLDEFKNLYDALTYLTPRVRETECLFWVDAICINQNDVEERSAQILHMSYIYGHAFAVYGWIGLPHDEEEVRLAVILMEKFDNVLAKHNDDLYKVITTIYLDNKDILPEIPGSECYKGWLGIKEMFQRSYWRRTWIYQEATLTQDTSFFCGDQHFTLNLAWIANWMERVLVEHPKFPELFRLDVQGDASRMAGFRFNGVIKTGDSLLELLDYLRATECSEPRDKVYAVLGMAIDLSSPGDIIPDYSKSLAEVYADVVRFSLSQADQGLQVLDHVTHPASHWNDPLEDPSFPSWVPDYRTHGNPSPFRTRITDSRWAYSACGAKRSYNVNIEGSRFVVKGLHADEIVKQMVIQIMFLAVRSH